MSPRLLIVLAACGAALVLAGCKGNCRQLSEKLCECAANTVERDGCLRRASSEESRQAPTAEDEDRCEAMLAECDCHLIDTPEGKRRCGLAY